MARRWWNFISLLTEKPYQTMFDSLQGWLAWYPLCEIWLWLQNSLNLFPVQMEGSSHPKHSTFQLKFCIFLGCELQGDKVLTHNYCKIMIIYIYMASGPFPALFFTRFSTRGDLHSKVVWVRQCFCVLHFEALWVETSETPQGLPGVSAHGRGAWSRSLVAELGCGAIGRRSGGGEERDPEREGKREGKKEAPQCRSKVLAEDRKETFLQWRFCLCGECRGLLWPLGGGWGLLGLVGVCGWFAISTRSPQPPP